ncbi:MAG: hypothetical protein NZ519_04360 [Bacteroidia bacterium]|nr:hypothetical protein [Bacteroidia bacterium]
MLRATCGMPRPLRSKGHAQKIIYKNQMVELFMNLSKMKILTTFTS